MVLSVGHVCFASLNVIAFLSLIAFFLSLVSVLRFVQSGLCLIVVNYYMGSGTLLLDQVYLL